MVTGEYGVRGPVQRIGIQYPEVITTEPWILVAYHIKTRSPIKARCTRTVIHQDCTKFSFITGIAFTAWHTISDMTLA